MSVCNKVMCDLELYNYDDWENFKDEYPFEAKRQSYYAAQECAESGIFCSKTRKMDALLKVLIGISATIGAAIAAKKAKDGYKIFKKKVGRKKKK